jgi:hypothetical protein
MITHSCRRIRPRPCDVNSLSFPDIIIGILISCIDLSFHCSQDKMVVFKTYNLSTANYWMCIFYFCPVFQKSEEMARNGTIYIDILYRFIIPISNHFQKILYCCWVIMYLEGTVWLVLYNRMAMFWTILTSRWHGNHKVNKENRTNCTIAQILKFCPLDCWTKKLIQFQNLPWRLMKLEGPVRFNMEAKVQPEKSYELYHSLYIWYCIRYTCQCKIYYQTWTLKMVLLGCHCRLVKRLESQTRGH